MLNLYRYDLIEMRNNKSFFLRHGKLSFNFNYVWALLDAPDRFFVLMIIAAVLVMIFLLLLSNIG